MTLPTYRTGDYGQHTPNLFCCFFFALLSLARSGVSIGFVERPIVAGFIWGLLTGDMQTALFLGVFYELFWLDLFPAGTYIAPNSLFPMLCVLTLSARFGLSNITTLFAPVILTLPLGVLGAFVEKRHREWQVAGYNRLIRAFRSGTDVDAAAQRSVTLALLQVTASNFLVFFCLCGALSLAYGLLIAWFQAPPTFAHASWPLLWTFGAFGGLLALRIRKSYALFVAGSLCLATAGFFDLIS